jgi:RNA polymerase sigma-70 factor (ECF subfamily)
MTPGRAPGDDRQEAQLVARARGGDLDAFARLVDAHAERVLALLRRLGLGAHDAEEVAQEVFVRAWRGLDAFEGRARLSTWLYRIAFNEARRRLDAPARVVEREPVDEELADSASSPHERAESAALAELLDRELERLPGPLRAAVVLRDVEGLSTAEAAGVMDVGEAAFKSRLHRGRTALRDALEPQLRDLT